MISCLLDEIPDIDVEALKILSLFPSYDYLTIATCFYDYRLLTSDSIEIDSSFALKIENDKSLIEKSFKRLLVSLLDQYEIDFSQISIIDKDFLNDYFSKRDLSPLITAAVLLDLLNTRFETGISFKDYLAFVERKSPETYSFFKKIRKHIGSEFDEP